MQVVANEPPGASSLQTGDTTWETNVRCRKIWSQGKGGIGVLHAWSLVPRSVPPCLSAPIRPTQTFLVSRLDSAAHDMRHNMQHRLPPLGLPLPCRQLRRTEWARPGPSLACAGGENLRVPGSRNPPSKKQKEPSSWMVILAGLAPGAVLVSGGEAPFRDRPVAMNDSP